MTPSPIAAGSVKTEARRSAVLARLLMVSKSFLMLASEIPGTRLDDMEDVTMVGMLISAVAIPVRYPKRVVACSTLKPATSSLFGTMNKSILETIGIMILAQDTGIARINRRFMIFHVLSGTMDLS